MATPLAAQETPCDQPDCTNKRTVSAGNTTASHKQKVKTVEARRENAPPSLPSRRRADLPEPVPFTQDYEPTPAIWKLSDEDTTIYMFGTFHILPEGFRWRSDEFNAIVEEVDELVVETSDDDSAEDLGRFMAALMSEVMRKDRVTISSRLSPGNREKWLGIADEVGMPRSFFDRMPLLLSMLSAGLAMSEQYGSRGEYGVETVLEAEFKAAGKPIGSIEDSGEVMRALMAIDEDRLLAQLDADLTDWNGENIDALFSGGQNEQNEATNSSSSDPENPSPVEVDVFATEHLWAKGELDEMSAEDFGGNAVGDEIYKVLLIDRNRAWAEWLENRLEQPGTILLAVGAGHFEGKDSVQIMLTERGLTAERLH
ncbi:hypothetical protein GRI41_05195 [Altererythrobacter aquaemixtae]|uniref:TraB/GumN family protein n=1 Tax=Pontixanthobacter aquaemixtae TaxID=1958940 RepID=A0A844ZT75_9SPHN|nr:hypothetical protein [Pontixanthobacter aquaemixtae]